MYCYHLGKSCVFDSFRLSDLNKKNNNHKPSISVYNVCHLSCRNPASVRMSKWLDRWGWSWSTRKYSISRAAVGFPDFPIIVDAKALPAHSSTNWYDCTGAIEQGDRKIFYFVSLLASNPLQPVYHILADPLLERVLGKLVIKYVINQYQSIIYYCTYLILASCAEWT